MSAGNEATVALLATTVDLLTANYRWYASKGAAGFRHHSIAAQTTLTS